MIFKKNPGMHREFNKLLSKKIITDFETKESSEDGLPM